MKVGHRRDSRPVPADLLDDPRLDSLATWGAELAAAGLSPGESGNLSCRAAEGFLITRTGVPLATIAKDDWVLVTGIEHDDDGPVVTSRGLHEPSKDASVHAVLYERRPTATSVFHLHVGHLDDLQNRLGVPATDTYHPAGTRESKEEIEGFLDQHPDTRYFVLIDHGIVAWGETVAETAALVDRYQAALDG